MHALLTTLLFYPAPREPDPDPLAKGFVGIQLSEKEAIVVTRVVPDSPADRGGLRENDEIVKIDGSGFHTVQDTAEFIRHCRPGNVMVVDVKRGGKAVKLRVKVGARPADLP